ncbi:hypothetical protein PIB30_076062 [Stylosanthes scabra]|uniref:Uncharacterized protein n=1 Tax=Stylosanthes scabra TaxID=79078 RepID=A0ABU6TSC4_9FABA|nr:hypothetical protein [Stylosanthes scabra]
MVDASAGGALMNKTPEKAWELIESMADNNQHFKVRATSTAKGVFEVTPSESTILAKSLVDIATMLKEIKEGQAAASKPLTQHANTSNQAGQALWYMFMQLALYRRVPSIAIRSNHCRIPQLL